MIRLLKNHGGGWKAEWVTHYNNGHRGLIFLILDVSDLDVEYNRIIKKGINITEPKFLQFKWFFNLLTRTMPWRNSYIDFFKGVPMQIGFQQMKDNKSREFMNQYMVPNSKDNGIDGIETIVIKGNFAKEDFALIENLFETSKVIKDTVIINLLNNQKIIFKNNPFFAVEVYTCGKNETLYGNKIEIENIQVFNNQLN